MRRHLAVAITLTLHAACGGDPDVPEDPIDDPDAGPEDVRTDPFEGLPEGEEQWRALCAKGYADTVSEAFCAGASPPAITSLADLRNFLGLAGDDISQASNLRVTAVFHSTAVSGRMVTPLNPRVFFMPAAAGPLNPSAPQPDPSYDIIAFSRGETFVELASKDRITGEPRFFLLEFVPACARAADGCSQGELLTPAVESGWLDYTLYDDETIDNTVFACVRCHENASGRKILRMQQLRNPWTHWFYPEVDKNIAAIDAFEAAHAGSRYGDLPATTFRGSRPSNLQRLIQNNDALDQPNEFDSAAIEMELAQGGSSPTWNDLYAEVLAGRAIPVPYVDNPPFAGNWDYSTPFQPSLDPQSEVARLIEAYTDVVNGAMPAEALPDVRQLFLPEAIDVLYRPAPGLDGRGILVQICSQCHSDRTDPTISRSRFNVDDLAGMSRLERDTAIDRLMMPDGDIRKMPPERFYTLSDAERQKVIDELSR